MKAPLAPIYTNFEGERAPKKNSIFLSKLFKKCPKTAFLTVFSKICQRRRKFCKIGAKQCFGRARKINLVDLKKKMVVKIFEFFLKIPPLEKILDPPLPYCIISPANGRSEPKIFHNFDITVATVFRVVFS